MDHCFRKERRQLLRDGPHFRSYSKDGMVHASPYPAGTPERSLIKVGGNGGEVEADETFISGKARNMHLSVRQRRITGTGTKDKVAVMGILECGGKVKTIPVPSRKKPVLQARFASMLKLARLSTPISSFPTRASLPSTPVRLWESCHCEA